ncbi:hypothetical protein Glove_51g55 [Diversispora epigaea]|uniref:Uncharacterized protein n=1 Tax=Diversispora epigaea TaxID=1348612 RepID=A0A397JEF0_9GLOM|nr:hypothetical protein Glove_51g55 [Diversispora epigaea]
MTWRTLDIAKNLPSLSSDYSASILQNGISVYIGGQEDTGLTYHPLVKMKNIIFNSKNVTGVDVEGRIRFSSQEMDVLLRIIIFGRVYVDTLRFNSKMYLYDITNDTWITNFNPPIPIPSIPPVPIPSIPPIPLISPIQILAFVLVLILAQVLKKHLQETHYTF